MRIFNKMKEAAADAKDMLTQDLFDENDWRYSTVKEILSSPKHMNKGDVPGLKPSSINRMKELMNESGVTDPEGNSLKLDGKWDDNLQYGLSQYIRPKDLNTKMEIAQPEEKPQEMLTAEVPSNPDLLKGEDFGEKLLNLSLLYRAGASKGLPTEGGQQSFKDDLLGTSLLYRKGQRDSAIK
ncbi:MAG: hypothetical protein H8E12_01700 [Rhodobacteraceae bacterium]|nr:hypothetical protein [Paracoccaceae bacterium]